MASVTSIAIMVIHFLFLANNMKQKYIFKNPGDQIVTICKRHYILQKKKISPKRTTKTSNSLVRWAITS